MSKNLLDLLAAKRLMLAILTGMGVVLACGPAGIMIPVTDQPPAVTPTPQVESPVDQQQCQNAAFLALSLVDHFGSEAKLLEATPPSQPVISSPANGSLLPMAPVTLTYRLGNPPSADYRYSVSLTLGRTDDLYLSSETYLPAFSGDGEVSYVWNPPAAGNYYLLMTVKYVQTDGAPSPAVQDIVAEGGSISLFLCFKISTGAAPSAPAALTCADRAAMLSAHTLSPLWGFDPAIPAPPAPLITAPPAEAVLPPGAAVIAYELGQPPSVDWVYQTTIAVINTREMTIKGLFESPAQVSSPPGLLGNIAWTADSPGTYLMVVWAQYVKIQGAGTPAAILGRGPYSYGFSCFTVK